MAALQVGFLTFTIDKLDRLRGQYGHEQEYARDIWRLRRLGITGSAQGFRLDFRGIEQAWLRTAVKQFLRWRRNTDHSPSGMHRDVIVLTQLSAALTDCAGADARPDQFDRAVIARFLTALTELGYPPTGGGRCQRDVAEQFLHDFGGNAAAQQAGGVGVARHVDGEPNAAAGT